MAIVLLWVLGNASAVVAIAVAAFVVVTIVAVLLDRSMFSRRDIPIPGCVSLAL